MIKIINESGSSAFVKYYASILSIIIAVVLLSGFVAHVFASDMTAALITETNKANVRFTGVKNISIHYPDGSSLAKELGTTSDRIEFTVNGTSNDPHVASLIQATNNALVQSKSPVQVTSLNVHYIATIKGGPTETLMSVKVDYEPTLINFVISKADPKVGGDIVDLDWRMFVVNGPVKINSPQYGDVNINQAIGALALKYPDLASKLSNSGAGRVLQEPILDFSKFNAPMTNWHFLFDPVGTYGAGTITSGGQFEGAKALSVYSLGESSFREGTFTSQETTGSASIDGVSLDVKSQTPPPSGQITIEGYSKLQSNQGQEYAIVTAQAPPDATTSSGSFPIQVLLVFGGMMGAIAIFILFKARK